MGFNEFHGLNLDSHRPQYTWLGIAPTTIHMAWYSTDTNATILERPNTQLALHQDLLQCFPNNYKATRTATMLRCYDGLHAIQLHTSANHSITMCYNPCTLHRSNSPPLKWGPLGVQWTILGVQCWVFSSVNNIGCSMRLRIKGQGRLMWLISRKCQSCIPISLSFFYRKLTKATTFQFKF